MSVVDNVLTVTEITEQYGVPASTIKTDLINCVGGRSKVFKAREYRKAGKIWLISKQAVQREYGNYKIIKKL